MVEQLKFVDSHNIAGCLVEPPVAHQEFKSMMVGLNNYRISHALRANLVIHRDLITELSKIDSINKQGVDGVDSIESMVKGTQIIISQQVIQEVLEFGDASTFPIMCYEGTYLLTMKKLLPPYWRFLTFSFVICISRMKGGGGGLC